MGMEAWAKKRDRQPVGVERHFAALEESVKKADARNGEHEALVLWTNDSKVGLGTEFCSILNDAIRLDGAAPELIKLAVPIIRIFNQNLDTRPKKSSDAEADGTTQGRGRKPNAGADATEK